MQKTAIVIPCYNEAERLNTSSFKEFIALHKDIEFLFVNDGSTDETDKVLKMLCESVKERAAVLDQGTNKGKAEAVRCGMLQLFAENKYDYIGFWDADLATPLNEINYLLGYSNSGQKKIIMASRIKRMGADVDRKPSRHIFGRIFSTFASIILKLPVYDTQCGAKLVHRSCAELFNEKFMTTWLFDIEILARFRNKFGVESTLKEIVEVPINSWKDIGGSKLKLNHLIKVPFELLKIKNMYNA